MNPARSIKVVLVAAAAALWVALATASPARATSPTRDNIGTDIRHDAVHPGAEHRNAPGTYS